MAHVGKFARAAQGTGVGLVIFDLGKHVFPLVLPLNPVPATCSNAGGSCGEHACRARPQGGSDSRHAGGGRRGSLVRVAASECTGARRCGGCASRRNRAHSHCARDFSAHLGRHRVGGEGLPAQRGALRAAGDFRCDACAGAVGGSADAARVPAPLRRVKGALSAVRLAGSRRGGESSARQHRQAVVGKRGVPIVGAQGLRRRRCLCVQAGSAGAARGGRGDFGAGCSRGATSSCGRPPALAGGVGECPALGGPALCGPGRGASVASCRGHPNGELEGTPAVAGRSRGRMGSHGPSCRNGRH